MIQSNGKYRMTTGYLEFRVNLPGTCSTGHNWSAVWTNGTNWPEDGEIDVMEVLDGTANWHYHWDSGGHRSNGGRGDYLSCESGWHTFGVDRTASRLDFYYDGRLVGSQTQGVVSDPHYIIVNYALSSDISPPVIVPSQLQVDYVRHFQRA